MRVIATVEKKAGDLLGFSIRMYPHTGTTRIGRITEGRLIASTPLKEGMKVVSIDGTSLAGMEPNDILELLWRASGKVTIVADDEGPAPFFTVQEAQAAEGLMPSAPANLSVGPLQDALDAAIEADEWDAFAQIAAVMYDSRCRIPVYHKFTRTVVAPAGKLGIVLDMTPEEPVVHTIKPDSPLKVLSPGDVIAAVDGIDTKGMDAASITWLLAANQERTLTVLSDDPLRGMEPNDIQVPLAASSNATVVPESNSERPPKDWNKHASEPHKGGRSKVEDVPATEASPTARVSTLAAKTQVASDPHEADRRKVKEVMEQISTVPAAVSPSYIVNILTSVILGKGNFGTVYKAWDSGLCRDFAVKVITVNTGVLADRSPEDVVCAVRTFQREQEVRAEFMNKSEAHERCRNLK
jgi:membrane-associated protease RseP (regulator of RpoE activity)